MKNSKLALILIAVLVLAPSFVQVERPTPPSLPTASIQSPKVRIQVPARRGPAAEVGIPSDLRLYALIDNECLESQHDGMATNVYNDSGDEAVEGLKLQAYSFFVSREMKSQDLVLAAEQDPCLLRIANDVRVRIAPPSPPLLRQRQHLSLQGLVETFAELLIDPVNEPRISEQLYLTNIKARDSWNTFFSPALGLRAEAPIIVAVVDSGVDYNHPDISSQLWRGPGGSLGYDFENKDSDPKDDYFHGTFVAGVIAANSRNNTGITGIAVDHVKIMAVKVVDSTGAGFVSNITNGIRWAADRGARVINLSLGVDNDGTFPDMLEAVRYASSKGAVVTVAAGNSGQLISSAFLSEPAMYSTLVPGVVTVGAIDSVNSTASTFSNHSPTYVQIAAPGSNGILGLMLNGQYGSSEGTSFSAPQVAAAAAMVIGSAQTLGLNLSNADVTGLILGSSVSNSGLSSKFAQGRQLDLGRLADMFRTTHMISSDAGLTGTP